MQRACIRSDRKRVRLTTPALLLLLTALTVLDAQFTTFGRSVEIGTSVELVSALAEPTVSSITIRAGVPQLLLEDVTFNGLSKLPLELQRNVTITGPDPDPNKWPLLLLYAAKKIQLADRVALTLRYLIARPAATEFFLRSPSLGILEASKPGSRSFLITRDAALFLPYGFPVELGLTYLVTLERPPELPGEQAGEHFFDQTGLPPINDTSVPIMSRARPGLGFFQDFALVSAATDELTGSVLPLNYYLWFINTYYFQEKELSAECLKVNDPVTCYLIEIKGVDPNKLGSANSTAANATANSTAATSAYSSGGAAGSDGAAPGSGSGGGGDSSVSTGTIVGAVVGSVLGAALLAGALAGAVLLYRRRRRAHPTAPLGSNESALGQSKGAGQGNPGGRPNGGSANGAGHSGGPDICDPESGMVLSQAAGGCEAPVPVAAVAGAVPSGGGGGGGGVAVDTAAAAGMPLQPAAAAAAAGLIGAADIAITFKPSAMLLAACQSEGVGGSTASGSVMDDVCAGAAACGSHGRDITGSVSSGAPDVSAPHSADAGAAGHRPPPRAFSHQHAKAIKRPPQPPHSPAASITRASTSGLGEMVIAQHTPFNRHLNLAIDLDESSVCSSDPTGSHQGIIRTAPGGSSSTAAAVAALGLAATSQDAPESGAHASQQRHQHAKSQAPSPPLNLSPALAVALNDSLAAAAAGPGSGGQGQEGGAQGGKAAADVVQLLPIVLGKGSFGRVLEGRYRGQRVAVKQLYMDLAAQATHSQAAAHAEEMFDSFMQEVDVLGRCDHPNIARLYAACLTRPKLALVMELADTSLDKLVFREYAGGLMPLPKVLHIATQIAQGLMYLHPTIVHRDLKPANVLINNPTSDTPVVKLADFGLARMRTATKSTCTPEAGTAAYTAPECFDVNNNTVTHRADIYSFGVVLWIMLTGQEPWPGLNIVNIAFKLVMRQERLPIAELREERCPAKLRRLLMQCWDGDPLRRPAAADLAKELALIAEQQEGMRQAQGPVSAAGSQP